MPPGTHTGKGRETWLVPRPARHQAALLYGLQRTIDALALAFQSSLAVCACAHCTFRSVCLESIRASLYSIVGGRPYKICRRSFPENNRTNNRRENKHPDHSRHTDRARPMACFAIPAISVQRETHARPPSALRLVSSVPARRSMLARESPCSQVSMGALVADTLPAQGLRKMDYKGIDPTRAQVSGYSGKLAEARQRKGEGARGRKMRSRLRSTNPHHRRHASLKASVWTALRVDPAKSASRRKRLSVQRSGRPYRSRTDENMHR